MDSIERAYEIRLLEDSAHYMTGKQNDSLLLRLCDSFCLGRVHLGGIETRCDLEVVLGSEAAARELAVELLREAARHRDGSGDVCLELNSVHLFREAMGDRGRRAEVSSEQP